MTTEYIGLSTQEFPEYMYFDGACYRLLSEDRRTNSGYVVDKTRLESFDSCEDCNTSNPLNTMYVTYE